MSEEEVEKWTREARNKELQMSPSCSSFEVLDPHDPVISRLATQLFKRTNDYLQGEMSAGQDHYTLLEEMNRLTITKYADLKNLAVNLNKTLTEYKEMCKFYVIHYKTKDYLKSVDQQQIRPLLMQIEQIDAQVSQLEVSAYRLDNYSKQLRARFKELDDL